jgi:hypothetical protein
VALRPALRVLRSLLSISDDLAEWRLNAALDVACMCIAANQEVCVWPCSLGSSTDCFFPSYLGLIP